MWYMNSERQLLVKAFRDFAQGEIKPFVSRMEENEEYPREIIHKMGKLGMLGLGIDKKYGGTGTDYVNYGLFLEEVAKVSNTVALLSFVASQLTVGIIHKLCTPEQVEKWVKPALSGDLLLSLANDESCGSGNISEFTTTAHLEDDEWVINGGKIFITNADMADVHVVTCITDKVDLQTLAGASLIAIPADTPGVSVGHMENKLGWKGSHTGQLYFNNVRVPKENLIGPLNRGYIAEGGVLLSEVSAYGPMDLESMEAVFKMTKDYLQKRVQNGKSIWDSQQSARDNMASLWLRISNFRNSVYGVLSSRNQGQDITAQAIALKIAGEQLLEDVVSQCIELHGGMGVIYETGIERFYRDSKMSAVGCGSNKTLTDMLTMFI